MRILDLQEALARPGDDTVLARRIVGLACGVDRNRLASTFDLALRTGALDHDRAIRLRRRLASSAESDEVEPDEALRCLTSEVARLEAAVEKAHAIRPRRAELHRLVAKLEDEQAGVASMLEARRRSLEGIRRERGRLAEILREVAS